MARVENDVNGPVMHNLSREDMAFNLLFRSWGEISRHPIQAQKNYILHCLELADLISSSAGKPLDQLKTEKMFLDEAAKSPNVPGNAALQTTIYQDANSQPWFKDFVKGRP